MVASMSGVSKQRTREGILNGRTIMDSKWVYTYKVDELGFCVRTKSRLVANPSLEYKTWDYHKTTSPIPGSIPATMLAFVASELSLPVLHLDVPQAFI